MQVLKVLPVFFLLGAAYAGPMLERRDDRESCYLKWAQKTMEESPIDSSIAICYHGSNTALNDDTAITDQSSEHFGWGSDYDCNGESVSCFWLRGRNSWKGYSGQDSANPSLQTRGGTSCSYNKDQVTVNCV